LFKRIIRKTDAAIRDSRIASIVVGSGTEVNIFSKILQVRLVWINRGLARLRQGYGAAGVGVDLGEQCPVRFRDKIVTLLGTTF
jgi:hypothetical protein